MRNEAHMIHAIQILLDTNTVSRNLCTTYYDIKKARLRGQKTNSPLIFHKQIHYTAKTGCLNSLFSCSFRQLKVLENLIKKKKKNMRKIRKKPNPTGIKINLFCICLSSSYKICKFTYGKNKNAHL